MSLGASGLGYSCVGYIAIMIGFGVMGGRKVKQADDFATVRHGYGPWFLALPGDSWH